MTAYRATTDIPPLVHEAIQGAERLAFTHSCTLEVGLLLRVLAAQVRDGTIGEIGSGCGVGTAWLASGLLPHVALITVESDPVNAARVETLLTGLQNIEVLRDDWRAIIVRGPFSLLFVDGGDAKQHPDRLLPAMRPGGLILLDDFTPQELWSPEWRGQPDALRAAWLNRTDIIATEILVTPTSAVILAVRNR